MRSDCSSALRGRSSGERTIRCSCPSDPAGPFSMPGMMDTILNLGLNDRTVEALARISGNECFAYDSYRRFLQMYSDVVLEVEHDSFEAILSEAKAQAGVQTDNELDVDALRDVVGRYKELIETESKTPFPDDPKDQLWGAIEAVFSSWRNPRAQAYRKTYRIPHDLGTAVNVQTMVYGNRGDDCGTGVAFTRNAANGEPKLFGEFLINAQGEDVVAGTRDPVSIDQMEHYLPEAYAELFETASRLERHYHEMQDLEFTVENGTLYLLQTRSGKRTARAAVRIAVDMANEGLITREQAVLRVEPRPTGAGAPPDGRSVGRFHASRGGQPGLSRRGQRAHRSHGEGSRGGSGQGRARDPGPHGNLARRLRRDGGGGGDRDQPGRQVEPRGRGGARDGQVLRGGPKDLEIDEAAGEVRADGKTVVRRGDWITVDGSARATSSRDASRPSSRSLASDFHTLMGWADEFRRLRVRTNADNPADAATRPGFGAEGIGLCRTEHMFFGDERIDAIREMILAAEQGRARRRPGQAPPDAAFGLSSGSSAPWTGCR